MGLAVWTTLTTTIPSPETIRREQERSLDHIPMNVIECYLRKKKLKQINEKEV